MSYTDSFSSDDQKNGDSPDNKDGAFGDGSQEQRGGSSEGHYDQGGQHFSEGETGKERVVKEAEVINQRKNNTLGIISLVTSILALVMFFCCFFIDTILAVVAIVCGILGYRYGQDFSLPGLIIGVVVLVLSIIWYFVFGAFVIFEGILG